MDRIFDLILLSNYLNNIEKKRIKYNRYKIIIKYKILKKIMYKLYAKNKKNNILEKE